MESYRHFNDIYCTPFLALLLIAIRKALEIFVFNPMAFRLVIQGKRNVHEKSEVLLEEAFRQNGGHMTDQQVCAVKKFFLVYLN